MGAFRNLFGAPMDGDAGGGRSKTCPCPAKQAFGKPLVAKNARKITVADLKAQQRAARDSARLARAAQQQARNNAAADRAAQKASQRAAKQARGR